MKFHKTPTGQYLRCEAEKGKCPYGAGADKALDAIREEAQRAFRKGEKIPTLQDTAGNQRKFQFKADGSYKFGAREYDRHGVLMLGESAQKKARLAQWRDFEGLDYDHKAEQFEREMLAYELARGDLKKEARLAPLQVRHFKKYAAVHHGGSIRRFFLSIWGSFKGEPNLEVRYKKTVRGMFQMVFDWFADLGTKAS